MFKTFLFAATLALAAVSFGEHVQADTQKGRCTVSATVHGGKKFAVLKCDRASHPGDYIIRSEAWEHKDRAAYRKLARFAGRRFTCDITYETNNRRGAIDWTRYNIGKCR